MTYGIVILMTDAVKCWYLIKLEMKNDALRVALQTLYPFLDESLLTVRGKVYWGLAKLSSLTKIKKFSVLHDAWVRIPDPLKRLDGLHRARFVCPNREAEQAVSEFSGKGAGILAAASTVTSTFLLVFVAEGGDKSFFSTIALAAASSPLGVIGGALAGHGAATLEGLCWAPPYRKSQPKKTLLISRMFSLTLEQVPPGRSSGTYDISGQRLEIGCITSRGRNELHVVVKNSSDIEIGRGCGCGCGSDGIDFL
ncbi:hypothetical protein Ancab_015380 [Ancistrocladus abbreviatus]